MIAYPTRTPGGALPESFYITGIVVYILMAVAAFLIFRYLRKNKVVMLGIIWFLVSISIVMHIIPIEGRLLAGDRYAYPSYIGLFLIAGFAAEHLFQRFNKALIWVVFGCTAVVLAIVTTIKTDTWANSKSLWEAALKADPKNHYAMNSLSLTCYTEEKNIEKALSYSDQAIRLWEDPQYLNNRGRIRFANGDMKGALDDFNRAISLDSSNFASFNNRGSVYLKFHDFKKSLSDYNKAIEIAADYTEARNNRNKLLRLMTLDSLLFSGVYISPYDKPELIDFVKSSADNFITCGQQGKAAEYLNRGIVIAPAEQGFYEMLAVMHQLNKEYDKALDAYDRGLRTMPANATLLLGRGYLFLETGDTTKACSDFESAASLGEPSAIELNKRLCR